jgi:hypothetical protein
VYFFWFFVVNLFSVAFICLFIFSFIFCWGSLGYLSESDLISYGLILLSCEFVFLWFCPHVKWVPVTTAWRVLKLRMEERPSIWRVAANKLNKQSRTADERWSSSFGVGRGAKNPPRENPC